MMICNNCDNNPAAWHCLQCDTDLSNLCDDCYGIHGKTKLFRGHEVEQLKPRQLPCCNCDDANSKFICQDCPEEHKYLCLGCSIIHPKIKQFRGHNVHIIESSSAIAGSTANYDASSNRYTPQSSSQDLLDYYSSLLEFHYDNLTGMSWRCQSFWSSLLLLGGTVIIYYSIVKMLFKGYAIIVNAMVVLAVIRAYNPQAFQRAKGAPSRSSNAEGNQQQQDNNQMFSLFQEFAYEREGGGQKARLRPRTRPYRPRPKPNSPTKTHSKSDQI